MRLTSLKNYKNLHIWTGIIAGLFLYICFVAGALTMFQAPLNHWALQDGATLAPIDQSQYDTLIKKVLAAHPEARDRMVVHLPSAMPQSAPVSWTSEDTHTHQVTQWHASLDNEGNLVSEKASVSAIGRFLDQLHRTAGIPGEIGHESIGTLLMGLVAGLYFLALVSGLIAFLPTWFKDFMSLRRGKNRKRYWLDFHNILGISALPFHLVIAITTFGFAFHDVIYGSLQGWVFEDQAMFSRPIPGLADRDLAGLATLEQIQRSIEALEPNFKIAELTYMKVSSSTPRLMVGGLLDGELVRGAEYSYAIADPFSAVFNYNTMLPSHADGYGKAVASLFALHFGNFGGNLVRWVYFGLGISGALLFLTGNILWIESRQKHQKTNQAPPVQTRSSIIMARITVGVSLGTLTGIALALLCAKWLPHAKIDIKLWQELAYYFGFLFSVFWSFALKPMPAARQLLLLTAALSLFIAVSNVLTHSSYSALPAAQIGVDVVAALTSISLLAVYFWTKQREKTIETSSVWAS